MGSSTGDEEETQLQGTTGGGSCKESIGTVQFNSYQGVPHQATQRYAPLAPPSTPPSPFPFPLPKRELPAGHTLNQTTGTFCQSPSSIKLQDQPSLRPDSSKIQTSVGSKLYSPPACKSFTLKVGFASVELLGLLFSPSLPPLPSKSTGPPQIASRLRPRWTMWFGWPLLQFCAGVSPEESKPTDE